MNSTEPKTTRIDVQELDDLCEKHQWCWTIGRTRVSGCRWDCRAWPRSRYDIPSSQKQPVALCVGNSPEQAVTCCVGKMKERIKAGVK